jgi:hypothetical protein
MTQTAGLEIIWRNPKPPQRQQRWEEMNHGSVTAQYLVQQLISTPLGPFWATTSNLELLRGGRVPSQTQEAAGRKTRAHRNKVS